MLPGRGRLFVRPRDHLLQGCQKKRGEPHACTRMVKKLEWIEMAQLAVSSILFKSLSLKLR
jgi:hypothetical protein